MAEPVSEPHSADAAVRLAEYQRQVSKIQHEINNPLAALLAEAQLLQLEPTLAAEQRASVRRMVELVRRVVVSVR